jgi:curli biogenesis system outer membrane secretion channel CsgG
MKNLGIQHLFQVLVTVVVMTLLCGCAETMQKTAGRGELTAEVGDYPPPPSGASHPRVGVPEFLVTVEGTTSEKMEKMAGDIMTTLATRSGRFDVIERAQLEQLLREQGLEGIVRPGELARPGQVRGVDYLLIGKVTNLRVAQAKTGTDFGLGVVRLPWGGGSGVLDITDRRKQITAECGVDIRLVDLSSGKILAAHFGEFERTDSAGAIGVNVIGVSVRTDAGLKVDQDSQGKILRLALDDAFRKMLPQVDRHLVSVGAGGEPRKTAAKFCSQCGGKLEPAAGFCSHCGAKVE